MSSLSLEVFKQKLETPLHPPPWGCWGNSCTGMRVGGCLGEMRIRSSPKSHSSLIHSLSTRSPSPVLTRLGTMGRIREKPPLSTFPNPIQGARLEQDRGQRMEALAAHAPCHRSVSSPVSERARGQGLGRGRHSATSSCTPPLLEVPEALGSFPNEVSGRALPN